MSLFFFEGVAESIDRAGLSKVRFGFYVIDFGYSAGKFPVLSAAIRKRPEVTDTEDC
jgi:hypothetical protein